MVRLVVDSLAYDFKGQKVVLLKDAAGRRILPIWIGPDEARAIALELEGLLTSRPQCHDLLYSILTLASANIMRVVINDLTGDTFFATIELDSPLGASLLDSRPSDAIALAVRARCPIFAAGNVVDALIAMDDLIAVHEAQNPEPVKLPDDVARFERLLDGVNV